MEKNHVNKLGVDIGSTTVKVAVLDEKNKVLFSDYERHFANIRETLSGLITKAFEKLGDLKLSPVITGSGGLTLAKHLEICSGSCGSLHCPFRLCPPDRRSH